MVAAIRELLNRKVSILWTTGMDLFGDIRDRMEKRASERDFIHGIGNVGLLAISDPIPVSGSFTEHQANMLYRIVDYRYSRLLPIWVTINVSDGSEFDTKLGAATADRIRDGATVIKCDWPSFRRANQ
jgi:DNA replication protein DnaC